MGNPEQMHQLIDYYRYLKNWRAANALKRFIDASEARDRYQSEAFAEHAKAHDAWQEYERAIKPV